MLNRACFVLPSDLTRLLQDKLAVKIILILQRTTQVSVSLRLANAHPANFATEGGADDIMLVATVDASTPYFWCNRSASPPEADLFLRLLSRWHRMVRNTVRQYIEGISLVAYAC